jgi:hypothetical protein
MNKKIFSMMGLLLALALWGAQATRAQEDVGRLLQELENNTDRFSKSFDNALDNSPINGTSTEGEVTRYVQQFEDSVDRLKKQYDGRKDARIAAQDVTTRARAIDKVMRKYALDATSQTDWRSVKDNINRLAKAYKVKFKW